jgi:hypothetical protein
MRSGAGWNSRWWIDGIPRHGPSRPGVARHPQSAARRTRLRAGVAGRHLAAMNAIPLRNDPLLSRTGAAWLVAALLGQWAFFYYIAAFYGTSVVTGDLETWNRLAALGRRPYVAGDTGGNAAFAAHALGAGLIALGGGLQLMPWIRTRWPRFHRWNGRVFLFTVTALSLSGFYLVWVRGTSPSTFDALSTSFNGLLILSFAFLAYRSARARNFTVHRHWAMRLYLVSNAQWFLRVGLFGYFIGGKALGLKPGFGDPFLQFWTFGCYLVPLAVLQLYFMAQGGPRWARIAVAALLVALTIYMLAGMLGFAMFSQMIISGKPLVFPK